MTWNLRLESVFGIGLILTGIVIILMSNQSFGKYGKVSKWFFDPPYLNEKYKSFSKKIAAWIVAGICIYFGLMLAFGRI